MFAVPGSLQILSLRKVVLGTKEKLFVEYEPKHNKAIECLLNFNIVVRLKILVSLVNVSVTFCLTVNRQTNFFARVYTCGVLM